MTSPTGSRTTPSVAFIQSSWHADLVDGARRGFLEVASVGIATVETFELPGAFEIPLHAKLLAETGRFDAIVAAGLIVDGGIYRHEFVADAVIGGLMRVQLDTGVPVFSCVLTPTSFTNTTCISVSSPNISSARAARPPTPAWQRWPRVGTCSTGAEAPNRGPTAQLGGAGQSRQ